MSAKLTANVQVDGRWYGPDYPDAGDPPEGAITNPAAFESPPPKTSDDGETAEPSSATQRQPGRRAK